MKAVDENPNPEDKTQAPIRDLKRIWVIPYFGEQFPAARPLVSAVRSSDFGRAASLLR
jgi:hypothetical protein